jgi:hypothetical protein
MRTTYGLTISDCRLQIGKVDSSNLLSRICSQAYDAGPR